MDQSVNARAEALAEMMEARMGVKGEGFEGKLRRAGRSLPKRLRRAGEQIAQAAQLEKNPKLARRIDYAGVERAAVLIENHLKRIDPFQRRLHKALDILAGQAFNLLVVAVLVLTVLRLRGYL
ncbi:hypothetical protein [Frigidibacter sp. ROC022]|uniref:hypothetical protein n=1 Tax=Frigidibacter sp. ROC022 TaxID=2971796 RepID=UPI00215AD5DD|nr:hypothetical protein [Frigidibacter sp. ROC022]MCR8723003.1 hypothetical protein [Frigidibacter sp. ROC022]